jgi:tyrosine recombinase xerC family protein
MTVIKQKDGLWQVDISDGISPLTGKRVRHRKANFPTKREAKDYEADYRIHHLNQLQTTKTVSISTLYTLLQEEDELRGNKKGTVDTQQSYYNQYISRFFEKADMALVTTQDIKKYRDWLIKQPSVKGGTLSAKHINQQMIFVHKLFDIAISKGFRKDNPCSSIRRLPDKHKEMSYYTPEQFKEFDTYFEKNEYSFQLLYRTLMYTGIRMGEALALTWNDVFLEEGCIRIHKSAYYRNGKTHIGTVKTTQSNRRIYIHKAFVNELRVWKFTQANRLSKLTDSTDDLQIFQFSGEPMTAPNVNNFRKSLKKRLPEHLKLIRNHDFRHSHAAFLISQGLRKGEGKDFIFFTLMKRLGHSSINTTINVYSHLFPSQQKEVANAFDDF